MEILKIVRSDEFALNYIKFRAAMHPTWCMAESMVKREES
jgi:hypothetical protein